MKQKHKNQVIENLEIIDIAAEGKAIGKHNDMVIFVTNVVPGDIVDVKIIKRKSNYREGIPVKFHKYSENREKPHCEHFGVCGGCKWQALPYPLQLQYKQKQVTDAILRIGKVTPEIVHPILKSENIYFYRNKLEYTFSHCRWFLDDEPRISDDNERKALGFHIPAMFDKILDIRNCYLQPEPSNSLRKAIKAFTVENNYEYFNLREHTGFLRNIIIRTSSTGEVMLIVIFHDDNKELIEKLLTFVSDKFPEITSLLYVINPKFNETIHDLPINVFKGNDYIFEQMEDLKFKIGPKSFYQTNSAQAYNLYKITREFAQLTENDIVYDLYTGTGTIANFVAHQCKKVIGIEFVKEAIDDAFENSRVNSITNTDFFAGDIKNVLKPSFIAEHGKPDVVIVDPPRAGILPEVIKTIMEAAPKRIVYVSCNPATQARDIALFSEKYKLQAIQPVDMFPQTHHVENIALLTQIE